MSGGQDEDALLRALGLWDFAQLPLAPPDHEQHHHDLAATYDPASCRIAISGSVGAVSASRAELVAALSLPPGPVAVPSDAALFSSAEAIAAVRRFASSRVLLGCGGDGERFPDEAVAALRLVEEGKAHAVDWGGLVWAVVTWELVMGKPWRCVPHLLRLIECQRPALFAQVDEGLCPGKRKKGMVPRQCRWTDGKFVGCKEAKMEEEGLVLGKSNRLQCWVTEAEDVQEGLVREKSKNIGVEINCSGDIGERPVLGKRKKAADSGLQRSRAAADVLVGCKKAMVQGAEILQECKGNDKVVNFGLHKFLSSDVVLVDCKSSDDEGQGASCGHANFCSSTDDSSFLSLVRMMDERDGSCRLQKVVFGTKSSPESDHPQVIQIDDANDDDNIAGIDRVGTCGLMPYLLGQQKIWEGIRNDRTVSPFHACMEQALACLPSMEIILLEKEKACRDTQVAIQQMKAMVKEKDCVIAATKEAIVGELQARHSASCRFEQDMNAMDQTIHQYRNLLKKSFAEFSEYKKRFGEGGESSSRDPGIADRKNYIHREEEQLLEIYRVINGFQTNWFRECLGCADQVAGLVTSIADLSDKVQILKGSRM